MSNNQSKYDNLSPLDCRYKKTVLEISKLFSYTGYIKSCLYVEACWLKKLSESPQIPECEQMEESFWDNLLGIIDTLDEEALVEIEAIENVTKHEIKAVEIYLSSIIVELGGSTQLCQFVHYGITSEDIMNMAYAINISQVQYNLSQKVDDIIHCISTMSQNTFDIPMLARTHGQPASPTTFGKEMRVYKYRLETELHHFTLIRIFGKFGGATGNMNACHFTYPEVQWPMFVSEFIRSFDVDYELITTQVSSHDWLACMFHNIIRINNILIDLCRDIWDYISRGYIILNTNRVGSSTMPHKINPIEFENAEGNLEFANVMFSFFADKLTKSRLQRDLSGSTVKRNVGVAFGHSVVAYSALLGGFAKIGLNEPFIKSELMSHKEVLTEALQTMMRKYGVNDSFEQVRSLSNPYDEGKIIDFINGLNIPEKEKEKLLLLTPSDYTGIAIDLVKEYV